MESNLQSIARLIDHIEEHLADNLNLDSLSQPAGYSKYHLHRMFTGITGFPIHSYIQRRRLTEAARLLTFTKRTIMDIALSAGYETQQSFTKAFGEPFGCSPHAYREKQDFYPLQLKFEADGKKFLRGDRIMDIKIIESGPIRLVGFRANTAEGFSVIGACWNHMNRIKDSIPHRTDKNTLIALDDYTSDFTCDSQPAFDYYAAVEVSTPGDMPPDMVAKELPASKYAVFTYRGSPQDSMQPVVEYIYNEWFPQSTAQLNEQAMYDFARLGEALDADGKGRVEFWVPIL